MDWNKVSEKLPDENRKLLYREKGNQYVIGYYYGKDNFFDDCGSDFITFAKNVTHWIYIEEPSEV